MRPFSLFLYNLYPSYLLKLSYNQNINAMHFNQSILHLQLFNTLANKIPYNNVNLIKTNSTIFFLSYNTLTKHILS